MDKKIEIEFLIFFELMYYELAFEPACQEKKG